MVDKLNENNFGMTQFSPSRTGISSWFGSWYYPIGRGGKFFAKLFSNRTNPTTQPTQNVSLQPPTPHPLQGDTIVRNQILGSISPNKPYMVPMTEEELERKRRYQEFEDMDSYPEIAAAFDIYADDSTQYNLDGTRWEIDSKDQAIKEEITQLFEDLNLKNIIWDIVRNTVKYGDCFAELVVDINNIGKGIQKVKILDPNFLYRVENEHGILTDFIQELIYSTNGNNSNFSMGAADKLTIPLDKNQIIHFRLFSSDPDYYPYGKSIAAAARRVYKSLKMMEDAMLIYRLARSPERRVFYVDTGNLPSSKAEHYLELQKNKFKKERYFNRQTGEIDARFNPMSQDEDFFVSVNGKSSGTKIETLPGAENLGEVDDVKYFRDKLLACLKIPKDYIVEKDQSPERKANLSQLDVKFARVILRVQQMVQIGLEAIAKRHLIIKGFQSLPVSRLKIKLPEPSDMSSKRQLDIDEQKARVVQAVKGLGIFPMKYIFKNYYQMNDLEILELMQEMEKQQLDPLMNQMAMGPGMGMDPMMGGAGPGDMEAGGQESAENIPPTQIPEETDYANLTKLMISEGLSEEAIRIVKDLGLERKINKNKGKK